MITAPADTTASTAHARSNGRGAKENMMLRAALQYAARGWAVIPLHTPTGEGRCSCGGRDCKKDPKTGLYKGKHPRTLHGVDDATRDHVIIRKWWARWPDANLGLACGAVSGGAEALDFENEKVFNDWRKEVGALADKLVIQTTGKGCHVIFRCDDPGGNQKLAFEPDGKTPLIETRGTRGYIMASPSLHPNGRQYKLIQGNLTAVPVVKMGDVDRLLLSARRFDQTPKETANPFAALVVPAATIAAQEPRSVDWLTQKFIERYELVLITAPAGMMKSLVMLDWAVCITSAEFFLAAPNGSGGLSTKAATVLWVNTDNSAQTHATRLLAAMRARGLRDLPLFSVTTTELELANPNHIKHLHTLAANLGADVIVLDTLSGALTGINENSAEEMTLPAAHLRALANAGRTIIGIHHPPKNDSAGSRGSTVLPNKADRVYSLSRSDDLLTIKAQKVRNAPAKTLTALAALEIDPTTEALTAMRFFDGQAARQDRADDELCERIREALAGGEKNLTSLTRAGKCRMDEVRRVLFTMRRAGEIKEKDGPRGAKLYRLVSQ